MRRLNPVPSICHPLAGPCAKMAATLIGLAILLQGAKAATIWNGPATNFSKAAFADPTQTANQDRMTANVWITRGSSQGIYNAQSEIAYTRDVSPAGTEWAYGTTAVYNTLTYANWETWHGNNPSSTVGQNAVLHLIAEDIYIDVTFTSWSMTPASGGAFSYQRSTPGGPPPNQPPVVTLKIGRASCRARV